MAHPPISRSRGGNPVRRTGRGRGRPGARWRDRIRRAGRPASPQGRRGALLFEQLVAEKLPGDPALALLARIVHGADFPEEMDGTRESPGLWAISQGFTDVGDDDAAILDRATFLYDSLYAHLQRRAARAP